MQQDKALLREINHFLHFEDCTNQKWQSRLEKKTGKFEQLIAFAINFIPISKKLYLIYSQIENLLT